MNLTRKIKKSLLESAELKRIIANSLELTEKIEQAIGLIRVSLDNGGKIMLIGNGGSAADAQHLAAEFIGKGMAAIALTTDTSVLTSIANDCDFGKLFSVQIKALGKPGDVLIAISTSGTSGNIVEALAYSKEVGITSIGLFGVGDGKEREADKITDLSIVVPSINGCRIQEAHIIIEHIVYEEVINARK